MLASPIPIACADVTRVPPLYSYVHVIYIYIYIAQGMKWLIEL